MHVNLYRIKVTKIAFLKNSKYIITKISLPQNLWVQLLHDSAMQVILTMKEKKYYGIDKLHNKQYLCQGNNNPCHHSYIQVYSIHRRSSHFQHKQFHQDIYHSLNLRQCDEIYGISYQLLLYLLSQCVEMVQIKL